MQPVHVCVSKCKTVPTDVLSTFILRTYYIQILGIGFHMFENHTIGLKHLA